MKILNTAILTFFLSLTPAYASGAADNSSIEPSDRAAALGFIRSAYEDLAQAQRNWIDRGSAERSACLKIAKINPYYQSNTQMLPDTAGHLVETTKFNNASMQAIQGECDPAQHWQRKTAILALHDEMVRLLDQQISELSAR